MPLLILFLSSFFACDTTDPELALLTAIYKCLRMDEQSAEETVYVELIKVDGIIVLVDTIGSQGKIKNFSNINEAINCASDKLLRVDSDTLRFLFDVIHVDSNNSSPEKREQRIPHFKK